MNPASTNVSKLMRFVELNRPDQFVVRLRAEGKTYPQIVSALEAEFDIVKAPDTIRYWFSTSVNGRLTQAYADYTGLLAAESAAEARLLVRRAKRGAVARIIELVRSAEDSTALRAAIALAADVLPANVKIRSVDDEDLPTQLSGEEALMDEMSEALTLARGE